MTEQNLPEPESALKDKLLKDYQTPVESTKKNDESMRRVVETFLKEHYLNFDFFALVSEANYGVLLRISMRKKEKSIGQSKRKSARRLLN